MRALIALVLFFAGCGGLHYPDKFHPPWPAPEVRLKTGAQTYSLLEDRASAKPAVTLVFFGFTHCPDICPSTLKRIADAMTGLAPRERTKLRVLFISIDPARDTPQKARDYAQKFHPEMIGLSGSADEIKKVAADYRVFSEEKAGKITHASGVYWINAEGGISKILPGDFETAKLLSDLRASLQ
jgi:protein SCO1/2